MTSSTGAQAAEEHGTSGKDQKKNEKLLAFWLPAFYFPQGFLTSVLQTYARAHGVPIDCLRFSFTPAGFSMGIDSALRDPGTSSVTTSQSQGGDDGDQKRASKQKNKEPPRRASASDAGAQAHDRQAQALRALVES